MEKWIKYENMRELFTGMWVGNKIEDKGAIILSELLKNNTTLGMVNIYGDEINEKRKRINNNKSERELRSNTDR